MLRAELLGRFVSASAAIRFPAAAARVGAFADLGLLAAIDDALVSAIIHDGDLAAFGPMKFAKLFVFFGSTIGPRVVFDFRWWRRRTGASRIVSTSD